MRFSRVYLEITNVCNLRCGFCPGTERQPQFLSPADFELLLQKLRIAAQQFIRGIAYRLLHAQDILLRLLDVDGVFEARRMFPGEYVGSRK